MASGADAPESLAVAGAHPGLIALVRAAKPDDTDAFLEELAAVLGRAEERRRSLQGAASYPALLATSGLALALILFLGVRPASGLLAGAATGSYAPPSLLPGILAVLFTSAALAYLALALRADPPVFPFSTAKRRQERAVILGAAACAAAHGAPLDGALAAAAALSVSPRLRAETSALAAALRDGSASGAHAPDLLGTLGGALFTIAASRGEGESALAALAGVAEASASSDLPNQVLRAELASMLIASAAIALSGIAIYQTYTAAIAAT